MAENNMSRKERIVYLVLLLIGFITSIILTIFSNSLCLLLTVAISISIIKNYIFNSKKRTEIASITFGALWVWSIISNGAIIINYGDNLLSNIAGNIGHNFLFFYFLWIHLTYIKKYYNNKQ